MRRSTSLSLFVGALVSALLGVTGSVGATNNNGVCETGELCVYRNLNYGVPLFDQTGSISDYRNFVYFNTTASPHDDVTSVWNRKTTDNMRVWGSVGYSGTSNCYLPGDYSSILPDGTKGTLQNDAADSQKFNGC